jgi:hypothetical protein
METQLLLRIKPGERPDLQDLWEYLQDLRYTDLQSSLLAYLLPFCLELWCENPRGTSDKNPAILRNGSRVDALN